MWCRLSWETSSYIHLWSPISQPLTGPPTRLTSTYRYSTACASVMVAHVAMTKCCVVQTFLGDIFSDLPEVSNFATSDRATYKTDPNTPLQHYLRRNPPEWAADRYTRAENAVLSMASTQEDMAFKLKCQAHLIDAPLAVSFAMLRRHCFPQSQGNQQNFPDRP